MSKEVKKLLDAPTTKKQFIDNIVELVNSANAYAGPYAFKTDKTIPQSKFSLQRESWDLKSLRRLTPISLNELLRQLNASIHQTAATARNYLVYPHKFPFMRGGGEDFFNKADVYQSWLDAKLSQLAGMNKSLSSSSKNKVMLIIDQIRTRENTLKLIDESLEALKLENNYNPEEISDLEAFKKFETKHNQVAGSLHRSYIKFADLIDKL